MILDQPNKHGHCDGECATLPMCGVIYSMGRHGCGRGRALDSRFTACLTISGVQMCDPVKSMGSFVCVYHMASHVVRPLVIIRQFTWEYCRDRTASCIPARVLPVPSGSTPIGVAGVLTCVLCFLLLP